ncbi:MAG: hypothetical protein JWN13_6873 [Betaproteobacteria bacterium]|nr:hypothetical protein [Betaproteobacteria bacterium]
MSDTAETHCCPVCNCVHEVNAVRARFAYGRPFTCSFECEAIRRRAWRTTTSGPMPGNLIWRTPTTVPIERRGDSQDIRITNSIEPEHDATEYSNALSVLAAPPLILLAPQPMRC